MLDDEAWACPPLSCKGSEIESRLPLHGFLRLFPNPFMDEVRSKTAVLTDKVGGIFPCKLPNGSVER